jgi:hypothetical protein
MQDEPTKRCPADLTRIDLRQPWEVDYWTRRLEVVPERLREAVRVVGSSAIAVQASLGKLRAAGRSERL